MAETLAQRLSLIGSNPEMSERTASTIYEAAAALEAQAAQIKALRADAERLEFAYFGRTQSNALFELELRFLNDERPTMDEVRAAFDAAMAAKEQ
jgi:hypothetical protein